MRRAHPPGFIVAACGEQISPGRGLDRSGIGAGEAWDRTLVEALERMRAFVCVCSGSYLRSENRGRELTVFRDRLAAHSGAAPPLLLPVLWDDDGPRCPRRCGPS